jgi:uncharacterized FlaG/YvyC family protein
MVAVENLEQLEERNYYHRWLESQKQEIEKSQQLLNESETNQQMKEKEALFKEVQEINQFLK